MIAIIKYNAGNVSSVQNALRSLGCDSIITNDISTLKKADKIIFPGVGAASSAMNYLREKSLVEAIRGITKPFLGICLGQQLMCKYSEEGDTKCLGIFDTVVKLFPPKNKVPHIGWNNFENIKGSLFKQVLPTDDVYFVHSYYTEICQHTIASCNYINPFSAALNKDNFFATQFHPEKSSLVGKQILKNFIEL